MSRHINATGLEDVMKATITYEWTEYGTTPLPRLRRPRDWHATRCETVELREHDPISPAIGDYVFDGTQWWRPIMERDLPQQPDWDGHPYDRVRNHTRYEEIRSVAIIPSVDTAAVRTKARHDALESFHARYVTFAGRPYMACGEPHWRLEQEYHVTRDLWHLIVCDDLHEHTDRYEWNITRTEDALNELDRRSDKGRPVDRTIPDMPVRDVRTVNTVFHDHMPIKPERRWYDIHDTDTLLDIYADYLTRLKTIPNILQDRHGVTMLDQRLLSIDQINDLADFRGCLRSEGMLLA